MLRTSTTRISPRMRRCTLFVKNPEWSTQIMTFCKSTTLTSSAVSEFLVVHLSNLGTQHETPPLRE
eukprot:TRINITY_DN14161_c0_g1_i1.p2 TRINITY_DN14161_c0_g1~~TRINITY_DN14161_c0_g1_i1.p2  ORF type:complete len:66 (+),score=5.07 TRINITY_DN14161_c0_g1_i1:263-460(+)